MWDLAEVPQQFRQIAELADKHGYLACAFGSVLKAGEGRDLDILMVSRFQEVQDCRGFLRAFGGQTVKTFQRLERSNHSYEVERDGKLYHFIFGRF